MSCEFFCLIFHLFPITKEFNSFWDTNTMHSQALFMVMEKNMLWFCSFFFISFFFIFPRISLKVKNGLYHGPRGQKRDSHFEAVRITKWTETSLVLIVSPGTRTVVLPTQVGFFSPEADGVSPSGSLRRRESQGLGYGRGGDGSQPSPPRASEMKGCRPRGVFHSVTSHAVPMGPGVGCSLVLKFLFQVAAASGQLPLLQSASTATRSSAATSDFHLFPPQRGATTFPNGSATCVWKLYLVPWRRQRWSGGRDNLVSCHVLPFWNFAGWVGLVAPTHPTAKMTTRDCRLHGCCFMLLE